ncbi:AAA family ATPase [Streptomyces sp. NBC_00893]|uniref:AAA family ATPase n=1 Tax=Streptomyces sp. NBC_00893 TaxID=2975862 RepID=UPI0022520F53|nr:AAA family ATPase [Streptomyces sp. NBC_00893]MCX4846356.1 AAA family ATPase [Streptomyces sp. NBC_00893]
MTATSWDILLIGGASGVGKSRAAAQLAGEPSGSKGFVVEFDDVVSAVEAMTTPEHHPALHHFENIPDTARLPVDRVLDLQIATARALEPAVLGVVRNRLTVDVPAVIEGDYLTPAAAAEAIREGRAAGCRVRAVFLHEPDPEQILANYAAREPDSGEQRHRAQVSAAYSHWLAGQAARHGLPVVECRPWAGLAGRVERALGQHVDGALSHLRPTLGP